MELTLKKIFCHGDSNMMVYISFDVEYSYDNNVLHDTVRINFNGNKKEIFATFKINHRGISAVSERVLDILTDIDPHDKDIDHLPMYIIEKLTERMSLSYDHDTVAEALGKYGT